LAWTQINRIYQVIERLQRTSQKIVDSMQTLRYICTLELLEISNVSNKVKKSKENKVKSDVRLRCLHYRRESTRSWGSACMARSANPDRSGLLRFDNLP